MITNVTEHLHMDPSRILSLWNENWIPELVLINAKVVACTDLRISYTDLLVSPKVCEE